MEQAHKVEIRRCHPVLVADAAKYLSAVLDCDEWHVVCRHDHLLVIHLSQGAQPKYAVRFECTAPVEKAIYHDNKAWSVSIMPLHVVGELPVSKLAEIKAGLQNLAQEECRDGQ